MLDVILVVLVIGFLLFVLIFSPKKKYYRKGGFGGQDQYGGDGFFNTGNREYEELVTENARKEEDSKNKMQ